LHESVYQKVRNPPKKDFFFEAKQKNTLRALTKKMVKKKKWLTKVLF